MYKTILREFKSSDSLFKTISIMNRLENESLLNHCFLNFVELTFNKNKMFKTEQIIKVHNWIYNNFVYKEDKYDETLISPKVNFELKTGDCDDYALFTKTVLSVLNINCRYILLGKEKGEFSHIANVCRINDKIIYIDSTLLSVGIIPRIYINLKIV